MVWGGSVVLGQEVLAPVALELPPDAVDVVCSGEGAMVVRFVHEYLDLT